MRRYGSARSTGIKRSGMNHEIVARMVPDRRQIEEAIEEPYLWVGLRTVSEPSASKYVFRHFDIHLFAPTSQSIVTAINNRDEDPEMHYVRTHRVAENLRYDYGVGGKPYATPSPHAGPDEGIEFGPIADYPGPGAYERMRGQLVGLGGGDAEAGMQIDIRGKIAKRFGLGAAAYVSPDDSWQKCILIDGAGARHPLDNLPKEPVTWFEDGEWKTRSFVKSGPAVWRGRRHPLRTKDTRSPVYLDDSSIVRRNWNTRHEVKRGTYVIKLNSHFGVQDSTSNIADQRQIYTRFAGPDVNVQIGIRTRPQGPVKIHNVLFRAHQWSTYSRDRDIFGHVISGDGNTRPLVYDYPDPEPPFYEYGPNDHNEENGWWKGALQVDVFRNRIVRPIQWNPETELWEDKRTMPRFGFDTSRPEFASRKPLASRVFYSGPMRHELTEGDVGDGTALNLTKELETGSPTRVRATVDLPLNDRADDLDNPTGPYTPAWQNYTTSGALTTEHPESFTGNLPSMNGEGVDVDLEFESGYTWAGSDLARQYYDSDTSPLVTPWSSYHDPDPTGDEGLQELGIGTTADHPVSRFVAQPYPYPLNLSGEFSTDPGAGFNPQRNRLLVPDPGHDVPISPPPDPYVGVTPENADLNPDFVDMYSGTLPGHYNTGADSPFKTDFNRPYQIRRHSVYGADPQVNQHFALVNNEYYELNPDKYMIDQEI